MFKRKIKVKNREERLKEKEKRFKKVASRRVQEVLDKLRLLKNCANTGNYYYTEEDVRKLLNVIESSWKDVKREFNNKKFRGRKFSFD